MRTTINIDDMTLLAVKERAKREQVSVGELVSLLLRQALRGDHPSAVQEVEAFYGFEPLPQRDEIISNEFIDLLREEEDV